ncbi:MAG: uL15m family ribosomal protein [Candidatus Woesearchaeota archaeon]
MVVKKRKKNTRLKGSRRWGWGRMHRGSGQRGGAGMSATGKKAQAKKPSVWGTGWLGKSGFKPKGPITIYKQINIKELEDRLERLIALGAARIEGEKIFIDLSKAGYNKLLSTGKPSHKYVIRVEMASESARQKISALGGSVELADAKKGQKAAVGFESR